MSARQKGHRAPVKPGSSSRAVIKSLDQLIATLQDADLQFSRAIDNRENLDLRRRGHAANAVSKAESAAADHAESAGSDAVDEALLTLCKYKPKTQDELYRYVRTLFQHERIRRGTLEHWPDRECAAAMLATINASIVSILFQQIIPEGQRG
jgi:hypothetical protein